MQIISIRLNIFYVFMKYYSICASILGKEGYLLAWLAEPIPKELKEDLLGCCELI